MVKKLKNLAEFEKSVKSLEAIVAKLEKSELPLEDALKYFEEGIQLSRACQETLKSAEQKVTQLIQENQDLVEKPFEEE